MYRWYQSPSENDKHSDVDGQCSVLCQRRKGEKEEMIVRGLVLSLMLIPHASLEEVGSGLVASRLPESDRVMEWSISAIQTICLPLSVSQLDRLNFLPSTHRLASVCASTFTNWDWKICTRNWSKDWSVSPRIVQYDAPFVGRILNYEIFYSRCHWPEHLATPYSYLPSPHSAKTSWAVKIGLYENFSL